MAKSFAPSTLVKKGGTTKLPKPNPPKKKVQQDPLGPTTSQAAKSSAPVPNVYMGGGAGAGMPQYVGGL